MGRIYQRRKGGTYWADYVHPATSKRYQRSLKTSDKRVAAERLRQHELAAIPEARGRKQRLSEAIDHVITTMHDKAEGTIEMYQTKKVSITKAMGDPNVGDVTRDMLAGFITARLKDVGSHTVAKELIVIRRALKESHDRGVLPAMPPWPRHSPKYKPRETWLTEDQFNALLAEIEPARRLWVGLATLAGGSAGEVERCDWAGVKLAEGVLRVPGTKRESRDRWVPIVETMYPLLDAVPPKARKGLLVERWGNVRRDLHAAVDRANAKDPTLKIPHVSPNDLRRTFASWLVQSGVDLFTVSKMMNRSIP